MPRLSAAKVQGAISNRWHVARISVFASGPQVRPSLPDRKHMLPCAVMLNAYHLHQYVSRQHWERLGKFSGNSKSHPAIRI